MHRLQLDPRLRAMVDYLLAISSSDDTLVKGMSVLSRVPSWEDRFQLMSTIIVVCDEKVKEALSMHKIKNHMRIVREILLENLISHIVIEMAGSQDKATTERIEAWCKYVKASLSTINEFPFQFNIEDLAPANLTSTDIKTITLKENLLSFQNLDVLSREQMHIRTKRVLGRNEKRFRKKQIVDPGMRLQSVLDMLQDRLYELSSKRITNSWNNYIEIQNTIVLKVHNLVECEDYFTRLYDSQNIDKTTVVQQFKESLIRLAESIRVDKPYSPVLLCEDLRMNFLKAEYFAK